MAKKGSKNKQQRVKNQPLSATGSHSQTQAQLYNKQGIAIAQQGQFAKAVSYFQKALALNPTEAEFHNNLGIALTEQGQLTQAISCYQQAITLNPTYAQAYYNLGNTLKEQYQFDKAAEAYQQAIVLNSNYPVMHLNLGNILHQQGKFTEAIACYQQALTLNPTDAHIYLNCGIALRKQGKFIDAIEWLQRALAFNPDLVEAHYNLGLIFKERGELEQAKQCYQQVITLKSDFPNIHKYLGIVLHDQGQLSEAIESYQQALSLNPDDVEIHQLLFGTRSAQGQVEETLQIIKELEARDQVPPLLLLNYIENLTLAALFSAHQRFNEKYALPLTHLIQPHQNDCYSQRKLKIGYLSADFKQHSVSYFIEPVLTHHDHNQFEIYCYHNSSQNDFVTRRLQSYADHWFDCVRLADDHLVAKIRQDQIDILVDLSGHTAGNRLLALARKPAPVQMTYLGYPATTGLTTIDYRITDNYVDPEPSSEQWNSETPIRMPSSYFCYQPSRESPSVNALPALEQGYITFGSFNNYSKLNPHIFTLWAQILHALPNAKLMVKAKSLTDPNTQHHFQTQFAQLGISSERLLQVEYAYSTYAHLQTYHQIDIGLDSYPYNGATTTCEALWMGVPVITLVGEKPASRMGLSILSTIGLSELVAYTPEEYVKISIKLANNVQYLQQLRTHLRIQMQTDPLMDAPSFTRHLETTYQYVWNKWCTDNNKL